MYIKVVMNLFFIIIFAKVLTLEFIGLHPYMFQVGFQEQAYMKLPKDGQNLGFNLYSVT